MKNYRAGHGLHLEAPLTTAFELFDAARRRDENRPALIYFDQSLSFRELDEMSDTLAAFLIERGFVAGNRLAVFLQNMPQFVIATLATWKAAGVLVPINPMNQEREVNAILMDCLPHTLICLDYLFEAIISRDDVVRREGIFIISTSARHFQGENDQRILPNPALSHLTSNCVDLADILGQRKTLSHHPQVLPSDLAFLVYTSGTTGVPKAALITHENVSVNARNIAAWYDLKAPVAPILAIAPLFHITGLVGHMALSWVLSAPLILMFRFEPAVVIDAIRAHRPIFTVGAITAYNALIHHPNATADIFDSFHVLVSGGAPIAPSVIAEIRTKTGRYVHNGYGLTETSAGVICVPFGATAPVDPVSGALSIGVPTFDVHAWIGDDGGEPVPIGQPGEIIISGPSVARGYWNKPEDSAANMRSDGFRTGDIGFVDSQGWFYLIDRKKDMINSSGYKVWPREVEDVLVSHSAVLEAAVIGISDAYRTESVCAVLSLRPSCSFDLENLKEWCQTRLAVYKRPRKYVILEVLPKTATGKISKRELRAMVARRSTVTDGEDIATLDIHYQSD